MTGKLASRFFSHLGDQWRGFTVKQAGGDAQATISTRIQAAYRCQGEMFVLRQLDAQQPSKDQTRFAVSGRTEQIQHAGRLLRDLPEL
jgi:hypothetical protein